MESQRALNIKYDDIFHYLEVDPFSFGDDCKFLLCEDGNPFKTKIYENEKSCLIPDPGLDANFKAIFINKEKRFENFINAVYFLPNNMQISNLEFIFGDFNVIGQSYNLSCLRADIACKGKLKINLKNNDETEDTKDTLINTEIQINWVENLDDRLFEYGSLLRNSYSNKLREKEKNEEEEENKEKENYDKKRVYLDTLVIAFVLGNRTKDSNEIALVRKKNGYYSSELSKFKIVEINLYKEWYLISSKGKSSLFGDKLSKDGKDWIKLISLRGWAKRHKKSCAKYYFPVLLKGHKYSSNKYINDTIIELIQGNRIILTYYNEIENYSDEMKMIGEKIGYEKGIKEGEEKNKESQLICAYYLFCLTNNIDTHSLEYKYNNNEVYSIINKKVNIKQLKGNNVDDFVNALKTYKIIENV